MGSKVVPNEELVDEDFLFWLLKREIQKMVRSAKLQGSTMKHIRRDSFLDHEFPLPPRPEQRRIAERLDAIQSRTQATGETLSQVPDRIEEYRQSVLNAAFTGQLTADWREDYPDVEPADELLERILDERRSHWEQNYRAKYEAKGKEPLSGWKSRYSEPESFETNEELFDIPDEWIWTNLAHLAISGPQNGLYLPKSEYGNGTPILRIDDYQIGWSRSAEELQRVEAEEDDVAKYGLNVGDLVINRVNSVSHLGKCLLIQERNVPSLFESNMMRLRPTSLGSRRYLAFFLQSARGRRLLIRNAKHAVNQASINQSDVKGTPVPLPPGEEQEEIVRRIRQRLDKIDEMAHHVEQAGERLEHLDRSVLAKAFRGELVETEAERARREDRDYETAEELLERVQGEPSSGDQSTSSEEQSSTTTQVGENGQLEMRVVEDDIDL
jgi:type I restriction enzyme S subunit